MSVLSSAYPSLPANSEGRAVRLAVVYHGARQPAAVLSILIPGGLPPNAGVLPIQRLRELIADPPPVAVATVDLDGPEGLSMVRALQRDLSCARIVVVARAAKDAGSILARQALNAGADAFVPEENATQALIPAVQAVVSGLICVPPVTRLVAKPTFSDREKEVLELLTVGLTNRQIADRLYLAESTVKSHLASAFAKLRVRSRKDAVAVLQDPEDGLWGRQASNLEATRATRW